MGNSFVVVSLTWVVWCQVERMWILENGKQKLYQTSPQVNVVDDSKLTKDFTNHLKENQFGLFSWACWKRIPRNVFQLQQLSNTNGLLNVHLVALDGRKTGFRGSNCFVWIFDSKISVVIIVETKYNLTRVQSVWTSSFAYVCGQRGTTHLICFSFVSWTSFGSVSLFTRSYTIHSFSTFTSLSFNFRNWVDSDSVRLSPPSSRTGRERWTYFSTL